MESLARLHRMRLVWTLFTGCRDPQISGWVKITVFIDNFQLESCTNYSLWYCQNIFKVLHQYQPSAHPQHRYWHPEPTHFFNQTIFLLSVFGWASESILIIPCSMWGIVSILNPKFISDCCTDCQMLLCDCVTGKLKLLCNLLLWGRCWGMATHRR